MLRGPRPTPPASLRRVLSACHHPLVHLPLPLATLPPATHPHAYRPLPAYLLPPTLTPAGCCCSAHGVAVAAAGRALGRPQRRPRGRRTAGGTQVAWRCVWGGL